MQDMSFHGELTAEEFYALPDVDELRHAELLDGEVVVTPPTALHQRVVVNLLFVILDWGRARDGGGEVTAEPAVEITTRRVYVPDVAWWPQERIGPPDEPPARDGPQALVVEVLSPSTRSFDVLRKQADYSRVGVEELWLIDPEPIAAQLYRRAGGELELVEELDADGVLASPQLPGLEVSLGRLTRRA